MNYEALYLVSASLIIIFGLGTFIAKHYRLIREYFSASLENLKKYKEVALLVDIGSGSIGVAFVLFKRGKIPRVLYNTRLPFAVAEKPDSSNLVSGMTLALNQLISSLPTAGFQISSVFITFSSPWFISKTKTIHVAEKIPFAITERFLDQVSATEEKALQEELSSDGASSFEVVEKSIIHTKVNGYVLDNSIGKKTNEFDAFLHMSVVPKSIIDTVSDIVFKHTHIIKEKFLIHTFPLVSFSVVRDLFNSTADFLLMDITGEVTDLTLVRDNVIVQTVSFPYGRNSIVRKIGASLAVTPEIAESTLHMYIEKKLEGESVTKVETTLWQEEKEWTKYFEDARSQFSEGSALPGKIYITADSDMESIFTNFLKLPQTDVIYVDNETFNQFYQSDSKDFSDEFIAILTIFYNKILKNK